MSSPGETGSTKPGFPSSSGSDGVEWVKVGGGERIIQDTSSENESGVTLVSNLTRYAKDVFGWAAGDHVDVVLQRNVETGERRAIVTIADEEEEVEDGSRR
jgi:hypothetical protein